MIELIHGDCLVEMQNIESVSVDMILCDLPYGKTACKWDTVIPFEPLWEQYKRIIKKNGAIVLFGSQPFTSALIMSNLRMFKYEWIWEKDNSTGFQLAKKRPLKKHENIIVFGGSKYNPQELIKFGKENKRGKCGDNWGEMQSNSYIQEFTNYPTSLIKFKKDKGKHPTQKPVALLEYLIKTYTNEGETVLDNCMGSGSTGVAARNLNRKFIGIEKDENYFNIAKERIYENTLRQSTL
jgi:site-specific DNA-methyltransferase (adenine-specific)